MRIEDIEVVNLIYVYPEGGGYVYSGGQCTHRATTLVRVRTDSRVEGIGACYTHPDMARIVIEQFLKPRLIGEDLTDIDLLWDRMYRSTRWFGRKGAALSALGALDIAFWDLRGRAAGKPVAELLGAGDVKLVPAYASGLCWEDDLSKLEGWARRYWDQGFRRMKMRLRRDPDYDMAAVEALLRVVGKRGDLMCDGSMAFPLDEAIETGKFLATKNIFWFEEPFAPEDIDSFVKLRGLRLGVRIATGENEFGHQGFRELIRAGAIDIAQVDASRAGGISEVMRVGRMAAEYGVAVAPHTWSDAVAVIANAHAVASLPNALTVEVDQSVNPFIEELTVEPLRIADGMLTLPKGPGLGIEVAWDRMKPYILAPGASIPAGNYSDMIFAS
jgi:D-galactarolactone cycloisomerase